MHVTLTAVNKSNWDKYRRVVLGLPLDQEMYDLWNPGEYDYEVYAKSEQNVFCLILFYEKIVGCISLFYAGNAIGLGAFYILPQYRYRNIGSEVLAQIVRLNPEKSFYLLCTTASGKLYIRHGFKPANFFISTRSITINPKRILRDLGSMLIQGPPTRVAKSKEDLEDILLFDLATYGVDRSKLLTAFISHKNTFTIIAPPDVAPPDESHYWSKIVGGYGIARPLTQGGYRLSIFALNRAKFESIYSALMVKIAACTHEPFKVIVDCVEEKDIYFESLGFKTIIRYPLLYRTIQSDSPCPAAVGFVTNPKTYAMLSEECG